MKKFFIIIFSILLFTPLSGYADEVICGGELSGYDLYTCRSTNICEKYKLDSTPLYKNANYVDASTLKGQGGAFEFIAFERAKTLYNTTITNHYKCGVLSVQKRSLLRIKDSLIKQDTTGYLKTSLENKLQNEIRKIDIGTEALKCIKSESGDIYNKLNILNQSTYEMCKYVNYLEYLKEYYKDIEALLNRSEDDASEFTISNTSFAYYESSIRTKIDDEKSKALELFPMAFSTYSAYENNIGIHFLLGIIKADFTIVRNRLQSVLHPINQVVYKISNVMKK